MDALVYAIAFATIAGAVFAAAGIVDRQLTLGAALLAAVYLGLDDLVTGLGSMSPALRVVDGIWNWSGKIYSLVFSALVLLALRIRPAAVGLTLTQRHLGTSLVALLFFAGWGLTLGCVFQPSGPSLQTLAFQALMPVDRTPALEPLVMWEFEHIRPPPLRTPQAVSCRVIGAA